MSNPAESVALSPFLFGEVFLEGVASIQRRMTQSMLAVFDAVADTMNDSLRAGAALADDIGHAETPVAVAAAGVAWAQGRMEKSLSAFRALVERIAARSTAPAPQAAAAPAVRRAPVVPQQEIRIVPKPPAGKLRRSGPILADKGKKPARPGAK
jgi:hypothetical protein